MVSLVFDRPERINPGETPARYQPKRIAATITGYWQAIPLLDRTITIAGVAVVPWLVYTTEDITGHPGDCGSPLPIRHADGTWSHAPALIRIHTYMQNHPDETVALEEMLPDTNVEAAVMRRILRRAWSGMARWTVEDQ